MSAGRIESEQGIPFDALSGGQQVLAGLLLQRGMRTAAGVPALMIVVDDVLAFNAGAGPWPMLPGPSARLVTTGAP